MNVRNRLLPITVLLAGALPLRLPAVAQTAVPVEPANPAATSTSTGEAETADAPLPDIPALMHDVEANQRKAEALEKDYIYRSVATEEEVDGQGRVKKTHVTETDHYWLNGVPVRRLVKKDGKEITGDELAKENDRIDKQAAKARERRDKADAKGKETDASGEDEVTVSRLLTLGAFTHPRRVQLNGRATIVVDYTGDPKARTRNRTEDAIREMAGTAWVDEQDHVLARVEGRFVNAYKIGGGLIADIRKDTHFTFEQTKVNGEVWLPAKIDAQGSARMMLFFSFNGSVHATDSDYRKFRATSTILPGVSTVGGAPPEEAPH